MKNTTNENVVSLCFLDSLYHKVLNVCWLLPAPQELATLVAS
jgi:hypothetical protein